MKPLPIKWRIGFLVAGVLVAVIISVSSVAYHEMKELLRGSMDDSLLAMANAIHSAFVDARSPEELHEDIRAITGNSRHGRMSIYRVWLKGSDKDISASEPAGSARADWLEKLVSQPAPQPGRPRFLDLVHDGSYRAIWARYVTSQGTAQVLILRSSDYDNKELKEFLHRLLVLGGSVVVGSVVLVIVLVLWAIKPVGQTAARLQGITHRNLGSANLADLNPPAELEPFVDSVSRLLSRLDEAIQRQEQFTADASHELRTPLAVAKSTLQAICVKDRSPAEYKQAILEAVSDLERIEHLTGQLLLLARMDASDQIPEAADVPLEVLLRHLAQAFDTLARQAGGTVACADMHATSVRGNEQQLSHLFGNLLDNAVKHGPTGRPVRVTLQQDSDGTCTVRIHDEGYIPPEVLPHIFDRFFRADSSRSRASGGSGLGLAIARKIARLHGGDIEIRSDAAGGTDALVHLPRCPANYC